MLPFNTQDSPLEQRILMAKNVNSVEVQRPCCIVIFLKTKQIMTVCLKTQVVLLAEQNP